jgi:predicted AAA+ superfamily ATPase
MPNLNLLETTHLFNRLPAYTASRTTRLLKSPKAFFNEVDFLLEHGRRLPAIEVKLTDNLGYRDTAGLRLFFEDNPNASAGLILYSDAQIKRLDEKIVAVPWSFITG